MALGIVPFALGTETGGSVVQPAAFAGVTGFRPTLGRIARAGVMALSARLDKVGVLAHTAADFGKNMVTQLTDEQYALITSGAAYVNAHSNKYKPGVVRGQIR